MKRNLFFSPHERIETRSKAEQRWSACHARPSLAASFRCIHCGAHVVTSPLYAGVLNRNHCPYCLWSRHLDLFAAGDRLCACKAPMRPLGLTLKQSRKKYVREDGGELMLIHACIECNNLSINRIAADDLADQIYEVYLQSLDLKKEIRRQLADRQILLLSENHKRLMQARLFGWKN